MVFTAKATDMAALTIDNYLVYDYQNNNIIFPRGYRKEQDMNVSIVSIDILCDTHRRSKLQNTQSWQIKPKVTLNSRFEGT